MFVGTHGRMLTYVHLRICTYRLKNGVANGDIRNVLTAVNKAWEEIKEHQNMQQSVPMFGTEMIQNVVASLAAPAGGGGVGSDGGSGGSGRAAAPRSGPIQGPVGPAGNKGNKGKEAANAQPREDGGDEDGNGTHGSRSRKRGAADAHGHCVAGRCVWSFIYTRIYWYRVAKTHRIPYLYRSFCAKVTYI